MTNKTTRTSKEECVWGGPEARPWWAAELPPTRPQKGSAPVLLPSSDTLDVQLNLDRHDRRGQIGTNLQQHAVNRTVPSVAAETARSQLQRRHPAHAVKSSIWTKQVRKPRRRRPHPCSAQYDSMNHSGSPAEATPSHILDKQRLCGETTLSHSG